MDYYCIDMAFGAGKECEEFPQLLDFLQIQAQITDRSNRISQFYGSIDLAGARML
jgi:hypothetical protein